MAAPRLFGRLAPTARSGPSRLAVRASSSSAFEPALAPGVEPAHDIALAYLEEQNATARAHAQKLKAEGGDAPSAAQYARIARAEVDAWVNDPATRRAFRATGGKNAMDLPVMRHLAERAWRKDGELDIIMQRINQLGVVPDLLADHTPSAAIRIAKESPIEPGSVVAAQTLATPPAITLQTFSHPATPSASTPNPEALYTLLVVDPDSPSHETQSFTQRLHYAKSDIPLSILSGETDLFTAPGTEAVAYEPVAPARGSGVHRYTFVVIRQGESANTPAAPAREKFDLRTYLSERNLSDADIVALTLLRSEWTEEAADHIDAVWQAHRGGPAPVYGKAPKELRYGYPLSAKGQRAESIREAAFENVLAELEAMQSGHLPGQGEPQQQ